MVIRVKNKVDLLHGIETMVKKEGIKNGVILAGIGSLRVQVAPFRSSSGTTRPMSGTPSQPADFSAQPTWAEPGPWQLSQATLISE